VSAGIILRRFVTIETATEVAKRSQNKMIRKTVFISCGQFTPKEKQLGKDIVALVRSSTDLTPFFAEEVHDLNGLDSNILAALRECAAFITVMHPRGEIARPDGSKFVRASTWIEQEIAIATYIQRLEKRDLPLIAFIHKSVGLEGIRTLIHLNPIQFSDESEILEQLPAYLDRWKSLRATGVELRMVSRETTWENGHRIKRLEITLLNKTNKRVDDYEVEVRFRREFSNTGKRISRLSDVAIFPGFGYSDSIMATSDLFRRKHQ
jgi:hypothetical protein